MPRPFAARLRSRAGLAGVAGLVGLLAGTALFRMPQNVGITTLSLLARQGVHAGAGAVGLLGSLAGLVVALTTLVVSRRIPHTRSAASAAAGMALLGVALLVLAVAPSYGVLVVGTVLLGAAGGIAMPGLLNAIVAEAPARREQVIAIYTVVLSVSLVVGPALETVTLAAGGQDVRIPFVAFAALPLVGAAVVAGHRRRGQGADAAGERAPDGLLPRGAEPVPVPAPEREHGPGSGAGAAEEAPAVRGGRRWRSGLLATAAGRDALLAELLYAVPFAGVTVFGALVARVGYGQSPARAQLGFTVFFVCSLAARVALSWRAPIAHKQRLLWLAALATVAGLVLLGTGDDLAALFVAMGLLGIPHGLTFPLALALVADATPVEGLPRANATLIGSTNLTSVLVPLALGAVAPAVGYKLLNLVMLGPVAVFGAARVSLARRPGTAGGRGRPRRTGAIRPG